MHQSTSEVAIARQKRQKNPNRCRPKSKGGCQRCKQRRRRCDETKPSCQECTKKGLDCPGYQKKPLEWRYVFKEEDNYGGQTNSFSVQLDDSFGQEQITTTPESQEEEVVHSKNLQSLWDEASSTLFDELPEIDPSIRATSKLDPILSDLSINKPATHSDSLSVLHRRLATSPVPSFLIHMPAILVQYYFDYVCKSWSSFDSPLNPFRIIVSRLWSRNAAIYYTIQSMAAASLANDFPGMKTIGIQTQQQAIACLRNNPRVGSLHRDNQDDEYFLALLMIGMTTAWHDAGDLGLEYLKEAKDHLTKQQQLCQDANSTFAKQYPLFQQCLLYWNMLAAFVAEDSLLLTEESVLEAPEPETSVYLVDGQALPHPWTGPFSKSLSLFYQTARVVRAARILYRTCVGEPDPTTFDFAFLMEEVDLRQKAERLEEDMLFTGFSSYCGPVDIGDTDTPPSHFITLAEAYRCASLLQIYHVFPDILDERIRLSQSPGQDIPPLFSVLFSSTSSVNITFPSSEVTRRILALHIVSLLDQIPTTSGTRCMHPIVLACISSDLIFSNDSLFGPAANAIASLNTLDVEIAQARRRVSLWLSELGLILPKLRMQRISDVVRMTWERADEGVQDYWLDVMIERGLETIMG
ncbi:hypothetical protein N7532_010532 [Penicillium argentinense]|uniref:Zn(2)-C6 fungal-type domain-containing protein n=1 Tax=Penicillium argentinense TaxID=1131581 RepID=A0A9W9EPV4_9EURO|nr:uncharacterized protein N7532_010532 [Penicillium argentinense]KAJ5085761.1 hypothetical protein N7532_010532 [Penicillium argentinense]